MHVTVNKNVSQPAYFPLRNIAYTPAYHWDIMHNYYLYTFMALLGGAIPLWQEVSMLREIYILLWHSWGVPYHYGKR